jgi:hypothetical protein
MMFGFEIREHDDDDLVTLKLMNEENLREELNFKHHKILKYIDVDNVSELDSEIYPYIIDVFSFDQKSFRWFMDDIYYDKK